MRFMSLRNHQRLFFLVFLENFSMDLHDVNSIELLIMLEIFTKDALCLLCLNTLLMLACRAPDIGELHSRMMEISNNHNKINGLAIIIL